MAEWTFNDEPAADLGISDLRIRTLSQAVSEATFRVAQPFDEDGPFNQGDTVIIKKDDDQWFYGRVIPIPRTGEARYETVSYVLADPWWYLERQVFQQDWALYSEGSVRAVQKSRCILGQGYDGVAVNNGAVVRAAVEWAIAAGAPLQIGTIGVAVPMLFDEVQDMTCAEIIRRVLRLSPDAVTWIDHSTTPPTFNVARRTALTAVARAATGQPVKAVNITARGDLQVPAVVLKYERTVTVDEQTYETVEIEKYPPTATGREWNALVATIELAGDRFGFVSQKIVSAEIPANLAANLAWWKARHPWFNDSKISQIQIKSVTRTSTLPRELQEGSLQDWMQKNSAEDTITALADYTLTNPDGSKTLMADEPISVRIVATNCLSGTFRRLSDYAEGEPKPVGLAKALYDAASELQFEGSYTIHEDECTRSVGMGRVLNLTGGRASWASMRALIQQVEEDIDGGNTTVIFGPAPHLGPGDLVDLLRANRRRRLAASLLVRSSGEVSDKQEAIALSGKTPQTAATRGPGVAKKLTITNGSRRIELDPALLNKSPMTVRELTICVDGAEKKIQILATEPY